MDCDKILNSLEWRGNSRLMYREILRSVPALFAGVVRRNICEWVQKRGITVVTEDLVFEAVDDIAPPKLANGRIKPGLEALRTK